MKFLRSVVYGLLIGICTILPGVSGGVLMVAFGLYQPVMALFAHPLKTYKTELLPLFPVFIGWILGFFGISNALSYFFTAYTDLAICLFLGLIGGTLPHLFKEAGKQGRTKGNVLLMVVVSIFMTAFFVALQMGDAMHTAATPPWFFVAGILWGMSMTIPGLSSSSLLIFMGLFEPMTKGLGQFDFAVILPLLAGAVVTVSLTARMANRMFFKHYAKSYHVILAIVLASSLSIIPLHLLPEQLPSCLGIAVIGFLIALFFGHPRKKTSSTS